MRIVIFGLPFSPNVGDGVIADCLSHGIRSLVPGAEVTVIDLSGRTGWGAVMVRNRGLALKLLTILPKIVRGKLVEARLNAMLDKIIGDWRGAVAGADLVVMGGGQLFSDADLNFPVKIGRASQVAAEAQVPIAVHGVGVARNWSPRGHALFSQVAKADLRRVAARDPGSVENWSAQMKTGPAPEIARDPGLLAAECYGATEPGPAIGVCITDPDILAYHAEAQVAGAGGGMSFWADLVETLASKGHVVRLFCNGAAEDRAALTRLAARPKVADLIAGGQASVARAPETSTALAAEIATHKAVVAHRLHACILAYAFGRPTVGLGWDQKVESFFGSVDLPQNFIEGKKASGRAVADRLEAALAAGIDPDRRRAVIEETRDGIARTLAVAKSD